MIGFSAEARDWGVLRALMLLAMLLFSFPAMCAESANPIVTSFVEDPSGTMTLDQVRQEQATPYRGFLSKGFTKSAFWIRVETSNCPLKEPVALSFRPHYIEEVALLDPASGKEIQVLGISQPSPEGLQMFRGNTFLIQPQFQQNEYWLRVRSRTTVMVDVDLQPLSYALQLERQRDFIYALYLGLLCMLLMLGLVSVWHSKLAYARMFPIYQLVTIVAAANIFGYVRLWLSPSFSPEQIFAVHQYSVLTNTVIAAIFNFIFMKSMGIKRSLLMPALALLVINLFEFGIVLYGDAYLALKMNNYLVVIYCFYLLVLAAFIPSKSEQQYRVPKWTIVSYYIFQSTILLFMQLQFLGIKFVANVFSYANVGHSFFSGFFMLIIVVWTTRKQKENDQIAIALAEDHLLIEKEKRQSQARLVSMLSHELKTPLFSIRTAIKRGAHSQDTIEQAVHDMSSVLERTALMNDLEDGRILPRADDVDLPQLIVQCLDKYPGPQRVRQSVDHLPMMRTDKVLLKVILNNLIDNALKYSPPESKLELSATPVGAGIAIVVENDVGRAGRPDVSKVFSKYYRSPMARQTGSGLGLYVVKGLSAQLGGQLNYAPASPKVRFELWLPS